jgi:hypothetical protein
LSDKELGLRTDRGDSGTLLQLIVPKRRNSMLSNRLALAGLLGSLVVVVGSSQASAATLAKVGSATVKVTVSCSGHTVAKITVKATKIHSKGDKSTLNGPVGVFDRTKRVSPAIGANPGVVQAKNGNASFPAFKYKMNGKKSLTFYVSTPIPDGRKTYLNAPFTASTAKCLPKK